MGKSASVESTPAQLRAEGDSLLVADMIRHQDDTWTIEFYLSGGGPTFSVRVKEVEPPTLNPSRTMS